MLLGLRNPLRRRHRAASGRGPRARRPDGEPHRHRARRGRGRTTQRRSLSRTPTAAFPDDGGYRYKQRMYAEAAAGHPQLLRAELPRERGLARTAELGRRARIGDRARRKNRVGLPSVSRLSNSARAMRRLQCGSCDLGRVLDRDRGLHRVRGLGASVAEPDMVRGRRSHRVDGARARSRPHVPEFTRSESRSSPHRRWMPVPARGERGRDRVHRRPASRSSSGSRSHSYPTVPLLALCSRWPSAGDGIGTPSAARSRSGTASRELEGCLAHRALSGLPVRRASRAGTTSHESSASMPSSPRPSCAGSAWHFPCAG